MLCHNINNCNTSVAPVSLKIQRKCKLIGAQIKSIDVIVNGDRQHYHGRPSLNNPRISVVDCGAPPRLAHATVMNGSTTYLEAAAYSCEEGYRFGGTADPQHVVTFICDGQGEWIGANISCEGGA